MHRKKGITLLLKIDDQTWQILAFLPHVPLSQPNSMNREERELIKLTINRGASPFWPQHRHHLCGRSVMGPVRSPALAAVLVATLDATLGTAHAAAVSSLASLACRVGKGYERLEESRRGTGHLAQIKNLRGLVAIRQLSYPC